MKETIKLSEDKTITLKASAATNILYKRAFHEDILVKMAAYTKNIKELKAMQEKIAALKDDKSKTQEQILEEINTLMNSEVFTTSTSFMNDTLPKLAYIMYLEANEGIETIFGKLTEEYYLIWLMSIDQNDLLAVTGQVIGIWQAGARTTSKPKN